MYSDLDNLCRLNEQKGIEITQERITNKKYE